ncbi:MAG: glycerol-3-phosphate 1-O-acyltransferase PlsY [Elusimicrobiales bacterium]|nr:glycerol-3-phosphate 1-O-acyltransferase PlsY [Elusimicrobiales bacterium]
MEITRAIEIASLMIISYVFGGVPTGYVLGKYLKGIDIRDYGSGNPGTANVYRTMGKWAGITTFIIDFLKGFLPTMLAMGFYLRAGHWWIPVVAGAVAIVGHIWTPFLNFKGGKGVATSAGVFMAIMPLPVLGALTVFTIVVAITKHISLGSMAASIVLPILSFALKSYAPLSFMALIVCALIFYTHIPNIRRIISGQELSYTHKKNKNGEKN